MITSILCKTSYMMLPRSKLHKSRRPSALEITQ